MSSKDNSEKLDDGLEKKKRRTVPKSEKQSASIGDVDVKIKSQPAIDSKQSSKTLFYAEENEVLQRDPREDLELHRATCNELRHVMTQIKDMQDISGGSNDTAKEIEEMRIHGVLQFVSLKKLNRIGHFRCKKVREVTNEAKQKIDQHHLRLQNLLYEVMHLQKEITKCLQFKSTDEEVSLVSVDEFYKTAPPEISKPNVTKKDEHQLTLARLDWELEQRKCLSDKLKNALHQKDVVMSEITTKKEYLESLHPKLNTILQSTKPVQDHLAMPFDETREQHRNAAYLPSPLYVLYMQAAAYSNACDKLLSVSIHGDVELAQTTDETLVDIEDDSDSEDEQEKRNDKHRRTTVDSRKARKQDRLLKRHPMSVCLQIHCKDKSLLVLTFSYFVSLQIVTVNVKVTPGPDSLFNSISGGDLLNSDTFLSCLYPDDFGNDTPNPANSFAFQRLGLGEFNQYIAEVGHPYHWVQWMCGLQFLSVNSKLPQKSAATLSASRMEETIKRLRSRIRVRLSVQKQLLALERHTIAVSSDSIGLFPAKVISQLSQWKRTTYEDFAACYYTLNVIECGLASINDYYFVGIIQRGSAALTFHVIIGPNYPVCPPVFVLSLHWKNERTAVNDEGIREMEAAVNIDCCEMSNCKNDDQLLTNQIQYLAMYLDVYLETEIDQSSLQGPSEFAREKMCPRLTRGPSRSKPFRYSQQLGFFSHK